MTDAKKDWTPPFKHNPHFVKILTYLACLMDGVIDFMPNADINRSLYDLGSDTSFTTLREWLHKRTAMPPEQFLPLARALAAS